MLEHTALSHVQVGVRTWQPFFRGAFFNPPTSFPARWQVGRDGVSAECRVRRPSATAAASAAAAGAAGAAGAGSTGGAPEGRSPADAPPSGPTASGASPSSPSSGEVLELRGRLLVDALGHGR